jgi:O-antigen/teichoic acid export membrane protein
MESSPIPAARESERPPEDVVGDPPGSEHGDEGHVSIVHGSLRLLVSRALASGAMFVAVLLLARALEPAGRGAVAFVMMAGLVLAGISRFGVDEATIVFAARMRRERSQLLTNLTLFTFAMSLLLAGLTVLVLWLAPSVRPAGVDGVELLSLWIGTVALALTGAFIAYLLGCTRFLAQAVVAATAPVLLAIMFGARMVAGELTVRSACVLWAAAQVVAFAVGLVAAGRVEGAGRPARALFTRSLNFGLRAWIGSLATFLNARVDQVIMGLIASEAALGIYAVSVNASEVALYLPGVVGLVIVPVIARSAVAERVETTLRVFRVLVLFTVATIAVGYALTPLLPVVFGSAYEPSITPYLLLLPGGIGYTALVVFSASALASSAPGRSSLGPLVAVVVGITLDFVLIPSYGATGAAIAASAAFLAGGIAAAVVYRTIAEIDPRMLVPRRIDFDLIRGQARRVFRRA